MKLWYIKIGKAFSALRQEGIIRGGKRVLQSFFALFRRVHAGEILFISGGLGDSARYRTNHVLEALETQGFTGSLTTQDNPFLLSYTNKFQVFVFHRVLYTPIVAKLIESLKSLGKTIIFETDDLVYDSEYLYHMDMWKNMNTFEKKQYEGGVGAEILADTYVKVCTTSTEYLAEKLRERGKKVFMIRQKMSKEDMQWAEEILKEKSFFEKACTTKQSSREISRFKDSAGMTGMAKSETVKIGYFSGTKSHDKDFRECEDALVFLLKKYPQVELFLAGPLNISEKFDAYRERIMSMPYVPRKENFENMASVNIAISPLEIGNPFCESKSELKFFEAGIVETPVVASATGTFTQAITEGRDGYTAKNESEWKEKLEKLILDEDFRNQMGKEARKTALEKYTTKKINEEYVAFLKGKCNKKGDAAMSS